MGSTENKPRRNQLCKERDGNKPDGSGWLLGARRVPAGGKISQALGRTPAILRPEVVDTGWVSQRAGVVCVLSQGVTVMVKVHTHPLVKLPWEHLHSQRAHQPRALKARASGADDLRCFLSLPWITLLFIPGCLSSVLSFLHSVTRSSI